jgi:hypothetical protein
MSSDDPLDAVTPQPVKRKPGRPRKHPLPPTPPPAPEVAVLDKLAARPVLRVAQFEPPANLPASVKSKLGLYAERNAQREMILALSGNGLEMILHAFAEMRGQVTYTVQNKDGEPVEIGPSAADQARAREFLAKYALTPAPTKLEVSGPGGGQVEVQETYDPALLSTEELQTLFLLKQKMRKAAIDAGPVVDAETSP